MNVDTFYRQLVDSLDYKSFKVEIENNYLQLLVEFPIDLFSKKEQLLINNLVKGKK